MNCKNPVCNKELSDRNVNPMDKFGVPVVLVCDCGWENQVNFNAFPPYVMKASESLGADAKNFPRVMAKGD